MIAYSHNEGSCWICVKCSDAIALARDIITLDCSPPWRLTSFFRYSPVAPQKRLEVKLNALILARLSLELFGEQQGGETDSPYPNMTMVESSLVSKRMEGNANKNRSLTTFDLPVWNWILVP